MAFGFNGFQVGKEIGEGLAKPIDLSQTTNFLLRSGMQQKELHQRMLQTTAKDLSNVDFKGVMRPDMPVLMQRYDEWRNLEVKHPEAAFNPRSPYYKQINDAKMAFNATKSMLVDGAKQTSAVSKFIMQNEMKDRHLTTEAAEKWGYLNKNGYAAFMKKYPDDVNLDQSIVPHFNESLQQANQDINKASNLGAMIPAESTDREKGIATKWRVAPGGYSGLMDNASLKYKGLGGTAKDLFQSQYDQMTPQEREDYADSVKSAYDKVGSDILGKKSKESIDNFEVNSPEDLFKGYLLKKYAPVKGDETQSAEFKNNLAQQKLGFSESMQTKRLGLSIQANARAQRNFDAKTWKEVQDEADKKTKEWAAKENERRKAANDNKLVSASEINQYHSMVLDAVVESRMRSTVPVPGEYYGIRNNANNTKPAPLGKGYFNQ